MSYEYYTNVEERMNVLSRDNAFQYGMLYVVSIGNDDHILGVCKLGEIVDAVANVFDTYKNSGAYLLHARVVFDPIGKFDATVSSFRDYMNGSSWQVDSSPYQKQVCLHLDDADLQYTFVPIWLSIPGNEISESKLGEDMVIDSEWFEAIDIVYTEMYVPLEDTESDCTDCEEND